MAKQAFERGAVVRLKSGGPRMTVVDYGKYGYADENKYLCKWFDEKNKLIENTFFESELLATTIPTPSAKVIRS